MTTRHHNSNSHSHTAEGSAVEGDIAVLSQELKTIAEDAERLIKAEGKALAEQTQDLRDRLAEALASAESTLAALETQAAAGMKATDKIVRSNPYQSLGIALGVGLLLGLLFKKK